MAQRILIIGAGNVGGALGRKWLERGHDVRFGVPDPSPQRYPSLPPDRLQRSDDRAGADTIVLAVPFEVAGSAVAALGDLSGVIVIDCTNPLGKGPDGLRLVVGHDSSGAEKVAGHAFGASVFKTLNQTGWENMRNTEAYKPTPVMFVAGDDDTRKPLVMSLVCELGFVAVDAGPLTAARLLEPLGMLWIELALKRDQGRDFAFAIVPRSNAPRN